MVNAGTINRVAFYCRVNHRDRNIGQDNTMKFQNRYPLSGMLSCPYCGKRSGADRFTRRKSNGFAAPTLKRESRHAKG